jgi:hypothetical protein
MSCERYAEAIVDHACGADLAPDAAAHLRACGACTALLHEQRRLIEGLDGELRTALAIEPSPQFAPRVRAAIETASASGRRGPMFWWSGLAAAAAAGILLVMVPSVERMPPPAAPVPTRPAPPTAASTATAAIDDTRTPREIDRLVPSGIVARRAPRQPVKERPLAEPEIIVSEDQQRAVARFVALVRAGRLDASSLATEPDGDIAPPPELAVSPLAVAPIAIPSVEFSTHSAVADGLPKGVEPR